MKRKFLTLILMLMVLATVAWLPPAAQCFGCTAFIKDRCLKVSSDVFMECITLTPYDTIQCHMRATDAYDICMMINGCPQSPKNP